jgi:hypothetical protein
MYSLVLEEGTKVKPLSQCLYKVVQAWSPFIFETEIQQRKIDLTGDGSKVDSEDVQEYARYTLDQFLTLLATYSSYLIGYFPCRYSVLPMMETCLNISDRQFDFGRPCYRLSISPFFLYVKIDRLPSDGAVAERCPESPQ